jgi:fatty acid desaturase
LLEEHPMLGRTEAVAWTFFWGAVAALAACVYAWSVGALGTPWTILGIILAASVLHEMEHDLIHDMYIPNRVARNAVFTVIWLVKATIDPWTRGRWHRWHHAVSGQEEDIEERLIGMGQPWGPFRLLMTIYPPVAIVLKPGLRRAIDRRVEEGIRRPDFRHPRFKYFFHGITGVLALLPIVGVVGWFQGAAWAWPLLVLWVLPNTIRHAAIATLSANSHYTGVERGVVIEQNQILDHPLLWPLAALCWNFGATHVLHHFLVRQPFWRRTLIFSRVREVLVFNGVPANDFASIWRANRRGA